MTMFDGDTAVWRYKAIFISHVVKWYLKKISKCSSFFKSGPLSRYQRPKSAGKKIRVFFRTQKLPRQISAESAKVAAGVSDSTENTPYVFHDLFCYVCSEG